MPDYVDQLLLRYRTRGLLVDTNLLLLYVVGLCDPGHISSFKRTSIYTRDDFELLTRIVAYFDVAATTPHVLTEVSNFLGQLPSGLKNPCLAVFRQVIPRLQEAHRPATSLCNHPHFFQLRLTDTGISEVAAGSYLVLTDDLPLYHLLAGSGRDALNFNHLRVANW